MNKSILISDPTLRDGNHAVAHQLDAASIASYCVAAETAGIPIVEVGHGNGLGASSMLVGEAQLTDETMLSVARESLRRSRLGVHVIPGFSTIKGDIAKAVDLGVDVFRIAAHCTEADITDRHIEYLRNAGREVYGVLMMSHMASPSKLLEEARKMEAYGAHGVVIMDSAGAYLPNDVTERIRILVGGLSIPVGFHGHNNLGVAVSNSVAAVHSGAGILDATILGFGAGAGNTQLEVLVAVLAKMGHETGINLYGLLDAAELARASFVRQIPHISPISVVSGLAGVFSGFARPVATAALEFGVDPKDIFFGLGRRNAVAGQESLIIEVALELLRNRDIGRQARE